MLLDPAYIVLATLAVLVLVIVAQSVKVVPQSKRYTVERFGKYVRTLDAGLSLIVPFLDRIGHRVSILERALDPFEMSVITKDNVEVKLESTVFFRITDPGRTMYRIENVTSALQTTSTSIVRSSTGQYELDQIQSSRERINEEIARNLAEASADWGVEITRTEVLDVVVDEETKAAQRQQLNAERERRAMVAKAEGDRRAVELAADAALYQAEKEAEAVKVQAEAEAWAIERKARAEAEQTRIVAEAIENQGERAAEFEIRKRQVEAAAEIGRAGNAKIVLVPAEVAGVLGRLDAFAGMFSRTRSG